MISRDIPYHGIVTISEKRGSLRVVYLQVILQKRVRGFHRVSKREKDLKPRGRRPCGFIVFERLET